jgi:hypothetical protein
MGEQNLKNLVRNLKIKNADTVPRIMVATRREIIFDPFFCRCSGECLRPNPYLYLILMYIYACPDSILLIRSQ